LHGLCGFLVKYRFILKTSLQEIFIDDRFLMEKAEEASPSQSRKESIMNWSLKGQQPLI